MADQDETPKFDWSAFYDDEGKLYYYNSKTEESAWDPPKEGFNPPDELPPTTGDSSKNDELPDAKGSKWIAEKDSEGNEYYYNSETGETQWEKPVELGGELSDAPQAKTEAAAANDDDDDKEKNSAAEKSTASNNKWVSQKDEEGNVYYYNEETGKTQWDKPHAFVDESTTNNDGDAKVKEEEPSGEDNETASGSDSHKESSSDSKASSKWKSQKDNEGNVYYYNEETQETQWEKPADYDGEDEQTLEQDAKANDDKPKSESIVEPDKESTMSNRKWVAQKDEEGNVYYYNEASGITQWEKPEGFEDIQAAAEDPDDVVASKSEPTPSTDPKEPESNSVKEEQPTTPDSTNDSEVSKWVSQQDDEGNTYYYNPATGETQWEKPKDFQESLSSAMPKSQSPSSAPVDAATAETTSKWIVHKDDEGREYYYNTITGDTQWEKPDDLAIIAEDSGEVTDATRWIVHKDDEGREYYYNPQSGETQWEKPEGATLVTEEELPEEETKKKDDSDTPADGTPPQESPGAADTAPSSPDEPEPMEIDKQEEPEEVIDPEVKKLQDAREFLNRTDSILEPDCFPNVSIVVASEGTKALATLVENYQSQSGVCGLLARWLSNMKSASTSTASKQELSESINDEIRTTAQDVIYRVAKERFSKDTGDRILDLSKSQAAFLEQMMDSTRWRKLLIDLSASHKESAVLMYCLRTISKKGHHREIARRINQSDHFAVFRQMLQSELSVIGKLAVSAGSDIITSIGVDDLINDLRRACTSTSYTYLYSLEVLKALEEKFHNHTDLSPHVRRAFRKWEFLKEDLESTMADPSASASIAGSSPIFRKRRLDVALTMSELHQRQRRRLTPPEEDDRARNGKDALESALLKLLRRHAFAVQIDDSLLDPLLPTGLDMEANKAVGRLLIKYPLAIRAMLGCLYKPGSARVMSTVLKNKCARLLAFAVVASEESSVFDETTEKSDEVATTRMILQGSQLCEAVEIMNSFLVTDGGKASAVASPGYRLCTLAGKCAIVAQGTMLWARELCHSSDFSTTATFPTLSVSILSLVRRIAIEQPFTRNDALSIALKFTMLSNPDVSYKTISAIKEQSIRLMIWLIAKGEASAVLSKVSDRLQQQPELDASLTRYFVAGLLEIIKPPVSIAFARMFAQFLRSPKCVDAVRSSYFGGSNQARLSSLLKSFAKLEPDVSPDLQKVDKSWIESVLTTYRMD